jgi:hypothetical protein
MPFLKPRFGATVLEKADFSGMEHSSTSIPFILLQKRVIICTRPPLFFGLPSPNRLDQDGSNFALIRFRAWVARKSRPTPTNPRTP